MDKIEQIRKYLASIKPHYDEVLEDQVSYYDEEIQYAMGMRDIAINIEAILND